MLRQASLDCCSGSRAGTAAAGSACAELGPDPSSLVRMRNPDLQRLTRQQLLTLAKAAGLARSGRISRLRLIALLAAREAPCRKVEPVPAALPSAYGRIRLTLMEIEPDSLYAYWEIPAAVRQTVSEGGWGGQQGGEWVLRFYDAAVPAADPGAAVLDVPVQVEAGNWYVRIRAEGRPLFAEAGFRAFNGRFVPLCRSNTITLPGALQPPEPAQRWMRVEGTAREMVDISGAGPEIANAPAPAASRPEQLSGPDSFGFDLSLKNRTP